MPLDGLLQNLDGIGRIKRIVKSPAHNAAAVNVNDSIQVHKAMFHCNIGYIHTPHVVRGHYSLDHYAYFDAALENMTFHRLNAVIGVLLLKGRLSLSLSGNNLLDRDTSYVLTRNLAGSHETWAPSMGRYYLLTASFRLNKTKPSVSFRGWD